MRDDPCRAIMSEELTSYMKHPSENDRCGSLNMNRRFGPILDVTIFHHPVAIFGGKLREKVNISGNPSAKPFGTLLLQSDPDFRRGSSDGRLKICVRIASRDVSCSRRVSGY